MARRCWTAVEDEMLRKLYPNEPTNTVAEKLGRSVSSVFNRAEQSDLHKSAEYLASPHASRFRRGYHLGWEHRFKKGAAPHNKGLRRPGWGPGRMKETQFKNGERRGVAAENYCPIGTIRVDHEGYQRIKVREAKQGEHTGFGNVKVWPLLQRHIWEQANGPIPEGHTIVFRDGNRQNVAIENLELISRADLMRRNSYHTKYPKEVGLAIQLVGALNRQIRKRDGKEHVSRPA